MPIPYKSRPRPEPRISTCNALLRRHGGSSNAGLRTLCIDIGGTGIKMIVLDSDGQPVNERARELTPKPATPSAVLGLIRGMLPRQPAFDRISVGFPGIVK